MRMMHCTQAGMPALAGLMTATCLAGSPPCFRGRADVSTSRRLDNIMVSPTAPRHPADHCSQVRVQSNGSGLSHTTAHHNLFTSSSGAMKNRAEQGARHIPWAPPACVLGPGPLDLQRLDFLTFDPVTCAKGATPPHPCLLRGRTCAEGCGSRRPGSRC